MYMLIPISTNIETSTVLCRCQEQISCWISCQYYLKTLYGFFNISFPRGGTVRYTQDIHYTSFVSLMFKLQTYKFRSKLANWLMIQNYLYLDYTGFRVIDSSWNVMAHGDAWEGKWRRKWQMEWVAITLHTTSGNGVSSITTADAHTSAASSRPNWRPRRSKWTRPFHRKTKSGLCTCAITFQLASTTWQVVTVLAYANACKEKP